MIELNQEIINAVELNSEMRKEIKRVFIMANRRLEFIAKREGKLQADNKFLMTGLSVQELKSRYKECISFLQSAMQVINNFSTRKKQ